MKVLKEIKEALYNIFARSAFENANKKAVLIVWIIYGILNTVALATALCVYTDISFAVGAGVLWVLLFYLTIRTEYIIKRVALANILICIPIAFFLAQLCEEDIRFFNQEVGYEWLRFSIFACALSIFTLLSILMAFVSESIKLFFEKPERFKYSCPVCAAISLLIAFINPSLTMLNNVNEYSGAYIDYVPTYLTFAVSLWFIMMIIMIRFSKSLAKAGYALVLGFLVNAYLQYMCLNRNLGTNNGGVFNYRDNMTWTIIDLVIWLVVFAGLLVFSFVKFKIFKKLIIHLPLLLMAVWAVTLVVTLITAPKECYQRSVYCYNGEKQFDLAKNTNIIMFIFDAVDNRDMIELLENEPECFEGLEDFTFYNNTCSVFDITMYSMPQMLSAGNFDEPNPNYPQMYKRLEDNNFMVNVFNYRDNKEYGELQEYFDNFEKVIGDKEDRYVVNSGKIWEYSSVLSMYQILPDILKDRADISRIGFTAVVRFANEGKHKQFYDNAVFFDNMNYRINDDMENAFIIQHTVGAHPPCDEKVEIKKCLDIMRGTVKQLKSLGLYDNCTIIATSDHGAHDDLEPDFPFASTPLFMIHSKGEHNESMRVTSAPEYHTDLLPTVLANAGLYDEEKDSSLFGSTIYSFKEGQSRERIWYNREYQVYAEYTYDGDMHELERVVKSRKYAERYKH